MIKESRIKTFSLVFGVLCAIALTALLIFAITLPSVSYYDTVFGRVKSVRSGSFDIRYLSSIILLAFGTYGGFALFVSIPGKKKEKKEECGEKKGATEPLGDGDTHLVTE